MSASSTSRSGIPTTNDERHDFQVPFHLILSRIDDDQDTEQHKAHRGQIYGTRSIKHYRHAKGKWGSFLEGFRPMWFAIAISSGGLSSLLNGPFPYPAYWQIVCATILYVFEIVLFVVFLALTLARWTIYPHVALRRALSADELGAYAIPPIALHTIAGLTATLISNSWGGHAFTLVAYVLWWIGVLWLFITALVVISVLIYTGNQMDRTMSPVLFMAPVGFATAGVEAGTIASRACCMSARLAGPMVVVGYFVTGVAFFMAILLYTIYFHRLLSAGWSAPTKRAAMFILIGPCGQISAAFQILGQAASSKMVLALYKPSAPSTATFWKSQMGDELQGSGMLVALLLLGFGYFWFSIAIIGVVDIFVRRQASYSLIWWSMVFPTVTLATSWTLLATEMDSPAFRSLASALITFIACVYFINLGFTLRYILSGKLLFDKTQAEMEDELMKKLQDEKADGVV